MLRSSIFLCLLGSAMAIRCWTGSHDPTKEWNLSDTECPRNQTSCSRSVYHNIVKYGCGAEACEGSDAAGCEEIECKQSLCNGRLKCWGGGNNNISTTTGLTETVCPDHVTVCSRMSTCFVRARDMSRNQDDITTNTYACGDCAILNDPEIDCRTCTGRLCNEFNEVLTAIPSLPNDDQPSSSWLLLWYNLISYMTEG